MARIYTRTGDDGTTGLIGGNRVSKHSLRIEAYGSIDELNSLLGLVRSHGLPQRVEEVLSRVQDELFTLAANLAQPGSGAREGLRVPPVTSDSIRAMERAIDELEAQLEPLQQFILPGGTIPGALLHLARTVGRRAERCCVALAGVETVDPAVLQYMNRLSDLLFVCARAVNRAAAKPEAHPRFGRSREPSRE
jgi:cob(I)alamin adenosyltransferase